MYKNKTLLLETTDFEVRSDKEYQLIIFLNYDKMIIQLNFSK